MGRAASLHLHPADAAPRLAPRTGPKHLLSRAGVRLTSEPQSNGDEVGEQFALCPGLTHVLGRRQLRPAAASALRDRGWGLPLGHRGDGVVRGAHLGQHLVQPLQRPVQVDLDPAGRARDVLAVVLGAPALQGKSTGSDWTAACGGSADTPSPPPRAAPGTRGATGPLPERAGQLLHRPDTGAESESAPSRFTAKFART